MICTHCGSELELIEYPKDKLVIQKSKCSNPECGDACDVMNYARITKKLDAQIKEAKEKIQTLQDLKLSLTLVMNEDDSRELLHKVYGNFCSCTKCRPDMHEWPECNCLDCKGIF